VAWVAALSRLPPAACLFAGALWLLNFHGINMAILWISGRTALLLTLFSVLAAAAALRGRPAAAALAFGAMLSKEEAVLLPVPLLVLLLATRASRRHVAVAAVGLGVAEAVYFALRIQSGSMTPQTAPAHYQFTFDWSQVGTNVIQYADRAATFTLLTIVLLLAIARTLPVPDKAERRLMLVGFVWALAGFAMTVFLPVRSSLYACFPSVGIAWAGAALATAIWRATPVRRQQRAAIARSDPAVGADPHSEGTQRSMGRARSTDDRSDAGTGTVRACVSGGQHTCHRLSGDASQPLYRLRQRDRRGVRAAGGTPGVRVAGPSTAGNDAGRDGASARMVSLRLGLAGRTIGAPGQRPVGRSGRDHIPLRPGPRRLRALRFHLRAARSGGQSRRPRLAPDPLTP
jgi:hypothetical protein